MENTSQSMELEDIKVDLGDNTLIVNPTARLSGSGSSQNAPDQPVNIVSLVVSGSGARDGSGQSGNVPFQKKERQKTSKDWNDFG